MYFYGTYDDGAVDDLDVAALPLDAIDPDLVGGLKIAELRKKYPLAFARSFDWLLNEDLIAAGTEGVRPRKTAAMWSHHLETLANARVCERVIRHKAPAPVATYFGLPKADRSVARSIVNCADISDSVRDSVGPVCLCPFPIILDALAAALRRSPLGRSAIWLSDLRHYYHQLKIASRHICVRCGDVAYVWLVLPMGHTCSCRVAQCTTWLLLKASGLPVPDAPNPPALLAFGRKQSRAGVVTVIYDNVIGAAEVTEAQYAALSWSQATDNYHAVRKYNTVYKGAALRPGHKENPVCCGLAMAVVETEGYNELRYKHAPANVEKWQAMVSKIEQPTLRDMARLIGVLIWDGYIGRLGPTMSAAMGDVIAVAKLVAKERFRTETWAAAYRNDAHIAMIKERVSAICNLNPWRNRVRPGHNLKRVVYVASDASSTGWGYTIFDETGELVAVAAGKWFRKMPMFLCEALAYLFAVRATAERYPASFIKVAIDAQAVAYAVAKGYSGSPLLNQVLERASYHVKLSKVLAKGHARRKKALSMAKLIKF